MGMGWESDGGILNEDEFLNSGKRFCKNEINNDNEVLKR
jgi:hypothetical protein